MAFNLLDLFAPAATNRLINPNPIGGQPQNMLVSRDIPQDTQLSSSFPLPAPDPQTTAAVQSPAPQPVSGTQVASASQSNPSLLDKYQQFWDSDRGSRLRDMFLGWSAGGTPQQSLALGAAAVAQGAKTRKGTNQTVEWLKRRGMSDADAAFYAGNPTALGDYLKTLTASQDPSRALQMQKTQLEIDRLKNPQPKFGFTKMDDGTLVRTDETGGPAVPVYNGGQKPTNDVQDYEYYKNAELQAGRQPMGPLEYEQAVRRAGATNINNTLGSSEKAFDSTVGAGYGKKFLDLQDQGASAANSLGSLQIMKSAMTDPRFYSGFGADQLASLKKFGVAFGLDPDSVKSIETFNSQSKKAVLDSMGGSLGAGISNADRDYVAGQVPTLGNTPAGNQQLIDIQTKIAQRKQQIAQLARQYAASHSGRIDAGFDQTVADYAAANPLFPAAPAGNLSGQPMKIGSVDDYRALPSGAQYIDPNGNLRTKQ